MEIDSSIPKPHSPQYYIDSFPLYISGQWQGTGQYVSSIINLDFDHLIQLREKLFIDYGYHFLQCELFRKINKQIYCLEEWALRRIIRLYHSNDLDYLNDKKVYISKLLKENNERLDKFKFQYVISLTEENMILFTTHFYTYSKMYEATLGEINTRIYMFRYHYDKNTGTFLDNYTNTPPTFDEFIACQVKKTDETPSTSLPPIIKITNKFKDLKPTFPLNNLKKRVYIFTCPYYENIETLPIIHTEINNKYSNLVTDPETSFIYEQLTPLKSYEDVHTFFSILTKDYKSKKKWIEIQEVDLDGFIRALFDFGNRPSYIPAYDIIVTGALWTTLWHELKIKKYIKATNNQLVNCLYDFTQNATSNKVSKSTYRAYISNAERRNKIKEDNKYISLNTIKSFLK
jgi:hypothetical protein